MITTKSTEDKIKHRKTLKTPNVTQTSCLIKSQCLVSESQWQKKREKMKNIKIVDYEHKYAEAVAVMWQNSAKGWNGETFLTTAQDVVTDEENSIHLNAWLALYGELVVGYCNLYEYQEDTGALYIGMLNVRDDYQGRKIGKALVLKAVERPIELGWESYCYTMKAVTLILFAK